MIKRFDVRPPWAHVQNSGWIIRNSSKGGLLLAAALAAILLLAQGAHAGGFALSGVGSKAIGMGGAFRGLADDWSAAYWNPAGLTQIKGSELNGMLVAISPKPQYQPGIFYGDSLAVGYRNGLVRYPNDKTNFVPDFSGFFNVPEIKGFAAGLALFTPFGLGAEWDLFNPTGMDLATTFPWYDHRANLTILDFHPAIARSFLKDKLSVGAGFSAQRGSITFEKTFLVPSGFPIPHENLIVDTEIKGTGWGFGANFGVLYKFNDKIQFGLSGKTGSTLKLKGDATQTLYGFTGEELESGLLSGAITPQDSAQIRALFAQRTLVGTPSAEADLKTPADFGFGVAVKPIEKLTITGDVAYTNWASLDSILIKMNGLGPTGLPAENSAIMLKWKNTVRISLGAEYWPKEFLALRFGYYHDPTPMPDETFNPLIPDMGDKNSVNIGTALKFSGLELAYNFEYIKFKDRTIASSALSDVNSDGVFDNYPGAYKMKLYASHLSLTYRF